MPIRRLISLLLPGRVRRLELAEWRARDFAAPSPPHIKRAVLLRAGMAEGTWVETGTYVGDTTAILAKQARQVYSIEPAPALFSRAQQRFAKYKNVEIIRGTSEAVFPVLLPKLSGDVSFWLDGHYSAGETFKGGQDTPIRQELDAIAAILPHLGRVVILVDDVRCFDPSLPEFSDYPSRDWLVEWAGRLNLRWHIEYDIFIVSKD